MHIARWLSLNRNRQEHIRELLERQGNEHVTNDDIGKWALSIAFSAIDAELRRTDGDAEDAALESRITALYCQQCSEQLHWADEEAQVYHNQSGFVATVVLQAFCPGCGEVYTGCVNVEKALDWMREGGQSFIPQSKMEQPSKRGINHHPHRHPSSKDFDNCQKWRKSL